jgi:hypothetical protein
VIPVTSDTILLTGAVYTETSNGNYPEDEIERIAWVYLNRVTSGVFPSLKRAVGPAQSALIAALSGDFPWLANLLSLSQLELSINLYQMHLAISSGQNSEGWLAAMKVSINVSKASSLYGYGSSIDPTGGATDFKAKSPEQWGWQKGGYDVRVNDPNWPSYKYSRSRQFYVGDPLGRSVILIFDNISLVTKRNPDLLQSLEVDKSH